MRGRRAIRIGLVLATAILTIALFLIVSSGGPINQTAYNRIQEGMSEEEVVGIMVVSPGNYATDFYTAVSQEEEGQRKYGKRLYWISDHAMINVEFDDRGKVCWKSLHELQTRGSFPQRLKSIWWSVRRMF